MNQTTVDIKPEVLAGISEMINDSENYWFDFDDGKTATCILFRETETKHFVIDIELEVHVAIHHTLGVLLTGLNLRELNVYDQEGQKQFLELTDKEIENQLNIF